jgi:hypothetical protein
VYWSRKPAAEVVARTHDELTVYLKFFCPQWLAPLQYLGSFVIHRKDKASVLFTEVNRRLGIPLDTALIIYEENVASSVRRLNLLANSDLVTSSIWTGHSLIFEFPSNELPPMTFEPLQPLDLLTDPVVMRTGVELPDGLAVHRLDSVVAVATTTLDQWVTRNIAKPVNITLFTYSNPTVPVAILSVPSTTKFADLCKFITQVTNADFVEGEDALLIYRKDYYSDNPDHTPVQALSYPTIQYLFYTGLKSYLYCRILKGVDPIELANGILLTIDFSEDSKTVARSIEVPMPRNAMFSALQAKLENGPFLQSEQQPLRFLVVSDGKITCPDRWLYERSRYVVALQPSDEIDLEAGEIVVFLTKAEVAANEYLEAVGFPTSMKVTSGLTLADAKPIIGEKLGIEADALAKAKIFEGDQWVLYKANAALKDDFVVSRMRKEATLLVVVNTRRKGNKGRRVEEPVKIDN